MKNDIKELFKEKFDKEEMKNEILLKEENKYNKLIMCIILITGIMFILLSNNKDNTTYNSYSANHNENYFINDIKVEDTTSSKVSVMKRNIDISNLIDELKTIDTPRDLTDSSYFGVYVDIENTNYLNNYTYILSGKDREIIISYSKENIPIRDYYFSLENTKTSIINNKELVIYKYDDYFYTSFTYNDINYDIKTNIDETELLNLLKSLIEEGV